MNHCWENRRKLPPSQLSNHKSHSTYGCGSTPHGVPVTRPSPQLLKSMICSQNKYKRMSSYLPLSSMYMRPNSSCGSNLATARSSCWSNFCGALRVAWRQESRGDRTRRTWIQGTALSASISLSFFSLWHGCSHPLSSKSLI